MNETITITQANSRYFVKLTKEILDKNLLAIVKCDSYIRQPCYSARAQLQFYFIVKFKTDNLLSKIKFINGEFPEFILNYLTVDELSSYPKHSLWPFIYSDYYYIDPEFNIANVLTKNSHVDAIAQAIVGVGHIARMYFLRDHNDKTLTWAVRQFGWALRYTEQGIISLWNLLEYKDFKTTKPPTQEIANEIQWVRDTIQNWTTVEQRLLSNVDDYQKAALKLNDIIQWYSKKVVGKYQLMKYGMDEGDISEMNFGSTISSFKKIMHTTFGSKLLSLYLSGSTARGDQHKLSDIDTIAIFSELDNEILHKLKVILSDFPKISVYSLSRNDLALYPDFRYYTLNLGTKKLLGTISFSKNYINKNNLQQAVINNLYTLIQVSRYYQIQSLYSIRAAHLLTLMIKLADHGCLRLIIKINQGYFPETKKEVKDYFNEDKFIQEIVYNIENVNAIKARVLAELKVNDHSQLIYIFELIEAFGIYLLERVLDVDDCKP